MIQKKKLLPELDHHNVGTHCSKISLKFNSIDKIN